MNVTSIMLDYLQETWWLTAEMSPYLLLGFIMAGLLRVFFTESWVKEHLGQKGIRQVIKAVLIGIPLPLCSCGVIPVAAGIRRQGGQRGAVAAFTASTPQTGIDSIAATVGMLGWVFMLVRVCIAFVNGIVAGLVVEWLYKKDSRLGTSLHSASTGTALDSGLDEAEACGCGCSEGKDVEGAVLLNPPSDDKEGAPPTQFAAAPAANVMFTPVDKPAASCCPESETEDGESSCCSNEPKAEEASCCSTSESKTDQERITERFASGMRFGLLTLPKDLFWALVIGLLIAGAIGTLAPADLFADVPGGRLGLYTAMTLISLPLYVCSTGSIPMAFSFLHAGMSPGAVLIFLIAGPASNSATVTSLWKIIGGRGTIGYILSIIVTCWIAAVIMDFSGISLLVSEMMHHHDDGVGLFPQVTGVLLILVLLVSKFAKNRK